MSSLGPFPAPRPLRYEDQTLTLSGVPLEALARRHGTPLYVYSADDLRDRVSLFQRNFTALPHTVCFAVKANSSLALLRLLGEWGCGFDIV